MGRYAELQKAWDENREEFRRLKEEMEKNEDAFLKIDQEMEAMEQEPIKDSDVVVMFSSQFETDYVVCKITDQSREWVKEQMNNIAGMDEDALANLDVEEYFRDQGAEVMSILASNGKGDDYPVFYDFWFDVDEAEVVESTELSIEKQVENLINRIDFGEPVLNDSEWKLLHTYAEKTGNMADTYKLAQELRDTLHHPDFRVHEQVIENARKAMSEILEDENLDYEDGEVLNYESFMEHVEEANRIEPQKLSEEYFSVYAHSAAYAREHGELEQYRISRNENIACKNAIEAAIRDNFDGMHLQPDAAEEVLDGYGMERVVYVLSSSIRLKEQDGRFSRENKEWAKTIPVAEDMDSWERNRNIDFLVDSHPAVLDGFVHLVRQEQAQREAKKEVLKVPPVSDKTEPEKALNQMSRVDIEETVLAYAQSMVDDAGYDVKVTAASILQVGIFQHTVILMNLLSIYLGLCLDNAETFEETGRRALAIAGAFNLNKLHPGIILPLYFTIAQGYMKLGNSEKALKTLEKYTQLATSNIYPLNFHGDEYFDLLDGWLENTLTLGSDMPRNQMMMQKSVSESIINCKVFEPLKDNVQFQNMIKRLKTLEENQ